MSSTLSSTLAKNFKVYALANFLQKLFTLAGLFDFRSQIALAQINFPIGYTRFLSGDLTFITSSGSNSKLLFFLNQIINELETTNFLWARVQAYQW